MANKLEKVREKRKARVRGKISGTEGRPRLSVFRSARHIFVQAIADDLGRTITEASTLSKELQESISGLKKSEAAREVGKLVSRKLQSLGIETVVFDRGPYLYHGRLKALADAAREAGLKF
ncbi:MAG: 50S ribosomal protein L18 [Smithellaceae bacterium]|nr:50S ribosomal protein L18 [Smithellaceae bacterium]